MTMRVGIAGTGTMGEVHAAAWRSTDAELIGCTSARLDQAEALARRYQMRVFSDYAELLNAVEIVIFAPRLHCISRWCCKRLKQVNT